MSNTVAARLDAIENMVKETSVGIVESGMQHAALMFVVGGNDLSIVSLEISDDRDQLARNIAQSLRILNADGYVTVTEVWATHSRRPLEEGIRVIDLPADDRVEELVVVTAEKRHLIRINYAKICNTPAGRKVGEWKVADGSGLSGRIAITEW